MMKKVCLLFLLAYCGQVLADDEINKMLSLLIEKNPEYQKVAVVYNGIDMSDPGFPSAVGNTLIVQVPIKAMRDLGPTILRGLLAKHEVQALFLVDDQKKLITHSRTVKFMVKQGMKYNFKIYSNADDLEVKVSGKISLNAGQLSLDLGDDDNK